MSDSLANAVELVALRISELDEIAPTAESVATLKKQLLQLVGNYRRRRDAAALELAGFRVFNRCEATLPGGELGAAVWLCSSATPDTFGVVVGAAQAEHFEVGARFKLVPE